MAFSVRNVIKFLEDHKKDFPDPQKFIAEARKMGGGNRGRIPAANVELLLGNAVNLFFREVDHDPVHHKILKADLP